MAASIFNGTAVKILKNILKFKDGTTISSTQAGYLNTITSDVQAQLNGKANTTLNNLGSTAVNANIVPDGNGTRALGTDTAHWLEVRTQKVISKDTDLQLNSEGNATGINIQTGGTSLGGDLQLLAGKGSAICGLINITTETQNSATTTGDVFIATGANSTANSGAISISTGTAGGTRGTITLSGSSINTTGQLLLSQDATASLGAVTKQQLDAAIAGVDVKEGVKAASTGNLTLSGEQTVDDIALVTGDRVLVKDQSTTSENGIYLVASGSWTRTTDADTATELENAIVTVQQGTVHANTGWYQTSQSFTLGADPVVFTQFFGAGSFTADGQGIELTGSTFSLELDGTTLSKSASGVKVASGGITNTEVNASAGIEYSKLNLSNSILDADINSSAGIAYSKLAALTASRALVSDGSGVVSVSAVTGTELGYVSGVTSSIQTQLNNKLGYSTQAISSSGPISSGITYLVDTSGGALSFTLPAPAANIYVIVKDIGNAETNSITVNKNSSETIDGAASYVISSNYGSATFVSDGTNWFII